MFHFPPVEKAYPSGLLATGGDLSVERLTYAYRHGIFPWFTGKVPMWYSPDPRFVLFPKDLKVSNSMKQVLRSGKFTFTTNQAFEEVIRNCSAIKRVGQDSTWITRDMIRAYVSLHEKGLAHSAEAWLDGELVGGLYGVQSGKVFCGESMFAKVSNASKFAFIRYVEMLLEDGCVLIDCQVPTEHLKSLGGRLITRSRYLSFLDA